MSQLRAFVADDGGATSIEYGLLASMIAVFLISAIYTFGNANSAMWQELAQHVAANSSN
jgi:pilus assembly protein Flp/PilA